MRLLSGDQVDETESVLGSVPSFRNPGPRPRARRSRARMIERGEQACFALEARHAIGLARQGLGQHLDGDVAADLRRKAAAV